MTVQQLFFGIDRNPMPVSNSTVSSGSASPLVLNYPASRPGDIIVAFVVAENLTAPAVPTGWTSLYANTITAVDGSGSGRRLMWTRRGTENTVNVTVNGGGNATAVALRNYKAVFSNVTEIAVSSSSPKDVSYDVARGNVFVILANQDGATQNPTISISNTTQYFSNTPGGSRSMALGYNTALGSNTSNISIAAENAYVTHFYVN